MHYARCGKRITEVTVRLYRGRCVPCHRKRFSQRLARGVSETLSVVFFFLKLPFTVVRDLPRLIRYWLAPLPVTKRQVIETLTPIYGQEYAKEYLAGLRRGFLQENDERMVFTRSPFYSDGHNDGCTLRADPTQWPAIVEQRLRRAKWESTRD